MEFPLENVNDLTIQYASTEYSEFNQTHDLGTFSALKVNIRFGRNLESFFIQVFVPAALIVVLSWLGFYINRNSMPARARLDLKYSSNDTTK